MNAHHANETTHATMTRRELFAGAGMTAGALAALAGIAGSAHAPAARAAARSREYFSSFVNLELDGAFAGRLLSATGGEPVIVPGVDPRQPASLRYEPLQLRLGDMSATVFDWVGKASTNAAGSRHAAVVAYDSSGKEVYRLSMQNARLIEIAFDGLDAASTDVLRLNAKILPAQSTHDLSAKTSYKGQTFKQGPLRRSNFRLYIQGVDAATTRATAIDPIGLQLRPDGLLAPMPLRFTLPLAHAAPLFAWMNDTLAGKAGPKPGELQLLSTDLSRVAASVSFDQLAILRMSCPVDASGTRSIQQVEVECQPASAKFGMGDLLA